MTRRADPPVVLRARLLAATAAGFLALARGDSATALQTLQAIPDTLYMVDGMGTVCFHLNFALARLLAARGEYRRAEERLERWRWVAAGTPTFVLATLELGRVAERLGECEKARESYAFLGDR